MGILRFRLPRTPGDPEEAIARAWQGHFMILLNRSDRWQVVYVLPGQTLARMRLA